MIKLIEKKLEDNNIILSETLLYLFEKNILIYLNNILYDKKSAMETEPLEILKQCIKFLETYIFKQKKDPSLLNKTTKLFCLGYIKVYLYTFICKFNENSFLFRNIKKIIEAYNEDSSLHKMIRIYIYKILYNNYDIDIFIDQKIIDKFRLKEYRDFDYYIKNEELINLSKINYKIKTLKDDYYEESYKIIEKYKSKENKNNSIRQDFDLEEFGIDNFYAATYEILLSNLQNNNYIKCNDFYKNICDPLFRREKLLFKAIQLFYDQKKYHEIKSFYKINSNNIKSLLFGYRYCLNEIYSRKKDGIYFSFYDDKFDFNYLKEKYYPGNDTKFSILYNEIINHFKIKSEEGCYVCLCENLYYHSIPSGFPGINNISMSCPKCKRNIGSIKKGTEIKSVKRENYYRIFKNINEIEKIKQDSINIKRLKEINYMTLEELKEKIIDKSQEDEKGIFIGDKNNFKNEMKIVRNLSQISYRILNYILYSNLFFAKLITNNKEFDKYLPKGMNWPDTINENWNIIKNELLKENIYSIENFMNYIFIELFPILNKEKIIDNYNKLIELENRLELKIKEIIKKYREYDSEFDILQKFNKKDKTSFISLLKENYNNKFYNMEEYPFYEYFYYTDYINEDYINKKLEYIDNKKYPVLRIYLENKNIYDNEKYSLEHLSLFNNVLNLINEKYFKKIFRKDSERIKIRETEIYLNNEELIEEFIQFYNNLKIKDNNNRILNLSKDKSLADFLIDDKNNIGRTFKTIYKEFIKIQNKKIESLLDLKIQEGFFDINCKNKIKIQELNNRDVFTLKLPNNISIFDIFFNSSYRKILDKNSLNYRSIKEYEINFDMIEETMTNLLLRNKKLFDEEIVEFIYKYEDLPLDSFDLVMNIFKNNYYNEILSKKDKEVIYEFYKKNDKNINYLKKIINDFIFLLKYLNDNRKENNENNEDNIIKDEMKISEINKRIKDTISDDFIKMFEDNNKLTVDKTFSIFDYYLKIIYEKVKIELNQYKEELNENSKELIKKYYQNKEEINYIEIILEIRLFFTLVLFNFKEKDNTIKNNSNEIINYLFDSDFNSNLKYLKSCQIKINQIISLYEFLRKDIDEDYLDDSKEKKESEESEESDYYEKSSQEEYDSQSY